ncbi:hypothetical protein Tco_1374750, partial [Tanacetum coccineum]
MSTTRTNSDSKLSKSNIEIANKIKECENDEDFARIMNHIRSSPTPSEDLFQDSQDPYDSIDPVDHIRWISRNKERKTAGPGRYGDVPVEMYIQ